jgi:hypothetical protein
MSLARAVIKGMGVIVLDVDVLWDALAGVVERIEAARERGERVDPADIDALVRLNTRIVEATEARRPWPRQRRELRR